MQGSVFSKPTSANPRPNKGLAGWQLRLKSLNQLLGHWSSEVDGEVSDFGACEVPSQLGVRTWIMSRRERRLLILPYNCCYCCCYSYIPSGQNYNLVPFFALVSDPKPWQILSKQAPSSIGLHDTCEVVTCRMFSVFLIAPHDQRIATCVSKLRHCQQILGHAFRVTQRYNQNYM